MGVMISDDTAVRDDKVSSYTIIGYKYAENDTVFLTTTDPSNVHCTKMARKEIEAMKAWFNADHNNGVFESNLDGIYIKRCSHMNECVHVQDKRSKLTLFPHVPLNFFKRL